MGKSIITLVLLIISLLVVVKVRNFIINNAPTSGAIPTVSISPEVTPTPTSIESTTVQATLGLNEVFVVNNTNMYFAAVIEDSRCPQEVQCIQAGKVRASIVLATPSGTSTMELEPAGVITTETLEITLLDVKPYPVSPGTIVPEEYKFTISVKNK